MDLLSNSLFYICFNIGVVALASQYNTRKDEAMSDFQCFEFLYMFWHCWLGDRKGIQPDYLWQLSSKGSVPEQMKEERASW